MTQFRTTREVAEALGVQEWRIESAIRRRDVARPPMVGGVRLWSAEAVERLRQVLADRRPHGTAVPDASAPAAPIDALTWTTDVPGGRVVGHMTCICGRRPPLIRQTDHDLVVEFLRCACGNFRPARGEGAGR